MFWVLICTVHLTVCSCHVTYAFQSESTIRVNPCASEWIRISEWISVQLDFENFPENPVQISKILRSQHLINWQQISMINCLKSCSSVFTVFTSFIFENMSFSYNTYSIYIESANSFSWYLHYKQHSFGSVPNKCMKFPEISPYSVGIFKNKIWSPLSWGRLEDSITIKQVSKPIYIILIDIRKMGKALSKKSNQSKEKR